VLAVGFLKETWLNPDVFLPSGATLADAINDRSSINMLYLDKIREMLAKVPMSMSI